MKRKIILYIAMSLDGYIADRVGGVDWLAGQDPNDEEAGSYPEFINSVDTVLLGYRTYHQIINELSPKSWVYSGKQSYVFTKRDISDTEDIKFVHEDVCSFVKKLKSREGKDIWVCGGAGIANALIRQNLIDRYHISVVPILIGDGLTLFEKANPKIPLKLIKTEVYNGIIDLVYEGRNG